MPTAASSQGGQIRVVFVTTSYPVLPTEPSGVFVARLVKALAERVHIEVITPAASRPGRSTWANSPIFAFRYAPWSLQRLAHAPGGLPVAFRTYPWLYLVLPAFLLSMFWACLRRGRKASLIHANWAPTGLVAGLAGLVVGVPVVTTIRGEDALRISRSRMQRLAMYGCVRLSRRVICVSEALASELAAQFPAHAAKFDFIPNGVGDDFKAVGASRDDPDGPLRLLLLGSLIPRKNVGLALRALARLTPPTRARLRLCIVGDGPELESLRAQVGEHALTEEVEFSPAVPPEAVPQLLAQVNAMLLCSRSEGRPNVVIEGMAAGLPIIASDIPGVRELVRPQREGLLFDVDDDAALAAHIDTFAHDAKLRRCLSQAGPQRVEELQLTWAAAAARYERTYRAALGAEA